MRRIVRGLVSLRGDIARLSSLVPPPVSAPSIVWRYMLGRGRIRRHRVRGWRGWRSGLTLFWLAAATPGQGTVVEIGSAWGLSTIMLSMAASRFRPGDQIVSIDPHTGDPGFLDDNRLEGFDSHQEFLQNLAATRSAAGVLPVRATSHLARESYSFGPIRLLFVDGLHSYEAVAEDIRDWAGLVDPDGVIAFDDYGHPRWPGVAQAIDEAVSEGRLRGIGVVGGLFLARVGVRQAVQP